MPNLKDFENKHNGETIWIIASGKSLDYIDDAFFNDKITVGVNQVFKKFVTKYLVRKEHDYMDEILKLDLNTIHFISRGDCGGHTKLIKYNSNLYNMNNVVIYDHDINKINSVSLNDNKLIVSGSTITTAIHLAAHMGAKYIILVGHDCGTLDGENNFFNYHTKETISLAHGKDNPNKNYKNWLKIIEDQTIKTKKLLKEKYGCEIYSLNPFINFGLEGHKYER